MVTKRAPGLSDLLTDKSETSLIDKISDQPVDTQLPGQASNTKKKAKQTIEKEPKTPYQKFRAALKRYTPQKTRWIPDWTEPSTYTLDPETTDASEWAWAFLRRNRDFQKWCDDASLYSTDDPMYCDPRWLTQWGLEGEKHYASRYDGTRKAISIRTNNEITRRIPPPVWGRIGPVEIIDPGRGPVRFQGVRTMQADLEQNQIAVVLDLNTGMLDPRLFSIHIWSLNHALVPVLERYRKWKSAGTPPRKVKYRKKSLLTILRIADALAVRVEKIKATKSNKASQDPSEQHFLSRTQIGRQLFNEGLILVGKNSGDLSDGDYSRAIQPHIKTAYALIYEHGYLSLLDAKFVSP